MNLASRRHFLRSSATVTLGFSGLRHFSLARSEGKSRLLVHGYGPLRPDPDKVLDLPKGFSYRIIGRAGETMDDGLVLPALPDGMAAFPGPDGLVLLLRNHEVNSNGKNKQGPFGQGNKMLTPAIRPKLFDPGREGEDPARGGVTTVVYDPEKQQVVRQFLSLGGTLRNCAGGPTPRNSWITCEETVEKADDQLAQDHGWCFETPATVRPKLHQAVPLKDMGRFNHEAVAEDPSTGYVYETEDRGDGLLYRFLPHQPGKLHEGGKLQALVAADQPGLDTRNWDKPRVKVGQSLRVKWLEVEEVHAPKDDLRHRGHAAGAARFARGEGAWLGKDGIYFACTNGGAKHFGQVWKLDGDQLQLFAEPNDANVIDNCDNLTVAPTGDLVLCEDGAGEQRLVMVTPKGKFFTFARNAAGNSELAGATFSPNGSILFVNIQKNGLTLAITGPWEKAAREG